MVDKTDASERIGYGRPPKRTRWKTGQCGNPTKKRQARPETELEMIERHLLSRFTYTSDGERRSITTIAAIMQRLVLDAHRESAKAVKVLQRYKLHFRPSSEPILDIKFEDNATRLDEAVADGSDGHDRT